MGKRLFDMVFSCLGLVVLSPFLVVLAIWIKLDSSGPIFFRQVRVGKNLQPFRIHKFRTMVTDAETKGLQLTVGQDGRITRCGAFLRRYKLDELPQLIDVLAGDMSLVGPRPEVPKYVAMYSDDDRRIVLSVKPGITDLASIEFKEENDLLAIATEPEKFYVEHILPIKLGYYREYVRSRSIRRDFLLILLTLKAIMHKLHC